MSWQEVRTKFGRPYLVLADYPIDTSSIGNGLEFGQAPPAPVNWDSEPGNKHISNMERDYLKILSCEVKHVPGSFPCHFTVDVGQPSLLIFLTTNSHEYYELPVRQPGKHQLRFEPDEGGFRITAVVRHDL